MGIFAWKAELSARGCELEKIALLAAEVNAELEGMLVPDPGDRIRNLINVLEGVFGCPERVPERGEAGNINKGQS